MRSPSHLCAVALGSLAALLAGCGNKGKQEASPSASASSSAAPEGSAGVVAYGVPIGIPVPVEKVVDTVNPKHVPPYAGPKGTLRGTVRVEGDPPPDTGLRFPKRCLDSEATYGKLFRVGLDKGLADALVAVTGYGDRGFVPADDEAYKLTIHRCVPSKRTYAVTFGQRVEVSNIDKLDSYVPFLDGAGAHTVLVAIPQGAPIKLYPIGPAPKHYMLRDQMDSGLVADVFLLAYATHAVTGLDGQYEIKNIPVGEVHVDVLLPVLENKREGQMVQIKEGDNTLDLTVHFDAAKDLPKVGPPAPAKPASSAKVIPRFQ
jgi:hypothetical protein